MHAVYVDVKRRMGDECLYRTVILAMYTVSVYCVCALYVYTVYRIMCTIILERTVSAQHIGVRTWYV